MIDNLSLIDKKLSYDDYNERLLNDIGEQKISHAEYDNLIVLLLEEDHLTYDLNLKLLREGKKIEECSRILNMLHSQKDHKSKPAPKK